MHSNQLSNFISELAAKGEYSDLKRELSRISRISAPASKLEEGNADEFDLDDFLNGLNSDQSSAGHVNKNLGLVWKDLTVMVRLRKTTKKRCIN